MRLTTPPTAATAASLPPPHPPAHPASVPTDFLLIKCWLPLDESAEGANAAVTAVTATLAQAARQFCKSNALSLYRVAASPQSGCVHVYAQLHGRAHVPAGALPALVQDFEAQYLHYQAAGLRGSQSPKTTKLATMFATTVSRLELVFDRLGHSHIADGSQAPRFHYVVETDPEHGWFDKIADWYDTEHMPGLAAVPGCLLARRMLNHDHAGNDAAHAGQSPARLSLACYDLVTQDTLGSPAWLAVRGTPWSDITRPHFTRTLRTMMTVIA